MEAQSDDATTKRITLNESQGAWINTPHGIIRISVGFGGIHRITSWLPHEIDVKKSTIRGAMQVTRLEPTYESVSYHKRKWSQ
tara:strand:+ start:258 stop:506 length:249 start_codon:yes stop_codon:yes gene_type:complete